jgi:pimeloyl-ACP methyl ester carboxylesterase
MSNSNNNHFKLEYTEAGSGPVVIMIHGMGSSRQDWRRLSSTLIAAGYRAVSVDLLGHGDSPKPVDPAYYSVQAIYTAFESWLEDYDAPGPYYLVGHSLGGYLSLQYSLRQPGNVQALTLINPVYTDEQIHPLLRYLSTSPGVGIRLLPYIPESLINLVIGWDPISAQQFSEQARRQIASDIKRASPQILNIPRSFHNLTPELGEVQLSCQVIWGDKDMTLGVDSFPPLVAALPNAVSQVITGTRHQPHITQPERFNPLVLDFINTRNHQDGHSSAG